MNSAEEVFARTTKNAENQLNDFYKKCSNDFTKIYTAIEESSQRGKYFVRLRLCNLQGEQFVMVRSSLLREDILHKMADVDKEFRDKGYCISMDKDEYIIVSWEHFKYR